MPTRTTVPPLIRAKKKKNIAQIQPIGPIHRSDQSNPRPDLRSNLAKAWTEDQTEEDRSDPISDRKLHTPTVVYRFMFK